jgi:hypothetical protein
MAQYSSQDELRQELRSWIAQFAPLIEPAAGETADVKRAKLDTIRELRRQGSGLNIRTGILSGPEDAEIVDTFNKAWHELDDLERETRRALANLSPGDPDSEVNIAEVREKIELREAREEVGLEPQDVPSDVLTEFISPPQVGQGCFLGVFALGWNGFTLFHMIFMIGGMWRSFGPIALLMLLFYSIFFAVGAFMAWAAFNSMASVYFELNGTTLTIIRKLAGKTFEKRFEIDPNTPVVMASPSFGIQGKGGDTPEQITFKGANGKPIPVGTPPLDSDRDKIISRINAYLAMLR